MIQEIYPIIHNHLLAELNKDNMTALSLPYLLWCSRHNNEFERLRQGENDALPVRFPAITVEFGQVDWQSGGAGYKRGLGTLIFRVGYEQYESGHEYAASPASPTYLNDAKFMEQAVNAIERLTYPKLEVVATRIDQDFDNIIVHEIEARGLFEWCKDETQYQDKTVTELCALPSLPTPPTWQSQAYLVGQQATFNGVAYICIANAPEDENPSNTSFWKPLNDSLYMLP